MCGIPYASEQSGIFHRKKGRIRVDYPSAPLLSRMDLSFAFTYTERAEINSVPPSIIREAEGIHKRLSAISGPRTELVDKLYETAADIYSQEHSGLTTPEAIKATLSDTLRQTIDPSYFRFQSALMSAITRLNREGAFLRDGEFLN